MSSSKPFTLQLIIIGGFLVFLYIFFALTTAIYRDYKLESTIDKFESEIERLAQLAQQKPEDVKYYQSKEYRDKYAKENLNLLNPGERLIIIAQEDQNVQPPEAAESYRPNHVLKLSHPKQWWEYFFGQTLSVQVPIKEPIQNDPAADQESLLELERQG